LGSLCRRPLAGLLLPPRDIPIVSLSLYYFVYVVDSLYDKVFEQHSMISHGPAVILRCYETCSLYSHNNVVAAQFETFPYTSLTQVLESRKAADFTTITSRAKTILNDVKGELEECVYFSLFMIPIA
jgi:hypothetical protein